MILYVVLAHCYRQSAHYTDHIYTAYHRYGDEHGLEDVIWLQMLHYIWYMHVHVYPCATLDEIANRWRGQIRGDKCHTGGHACLMCNALDVLTSGGHCNWLEIKLDKFMF